MWQKTGIANIQYIFWFIFIKCQFANIVFEAVSVLKFCLFGVLDLIVKYSLNTDYNVLESALQWERIKAEIINKSEKNQILWHLSLSTSDKNHLTSETARSQKCGSKSDVMNRLNIKCVQKLSFLFCANSFENLLNFKNIQYQLTKKKV